MVTKMDIKTDMQKDLHGLHFLLFLLAVSVWNTELLVLGEVGRVDISQVPKIRLRMVTVSDIETNIQKRFASIAFFVKFLHSSVYVCDAE